MVSALAMQPVFLVAATQPISFSLLYNQSAMESQVLAAARRFLAPTDSSPYYSPLSVAGDSAPAVSDIRSAMPW